MRLYLPLILFLIISSIWIGCGGGKSPITPSIDPAALPSDTSIAQFSSPDSTKSGMIGLFTGYVDSVSMTGELVPIRENMSQDALEVIDITNFLTATPCIDCARIRNVHLTDEGKLAVDIGIRHPFPSGNPSLPPSGKNRLDLHLFNVEGIFIVDSGVHINFPSLATKIDVKGLLNPDGYTSYLDSSLDSIYPTEASAHPYIQHFVDYTDGNFDPDISPNGFLDVTNPSGYHVMRMGSDEDVKTYVLNLEENESIEFIFAIGATYGISADSYIQRLNPAYRMPQFNKKAASKISVEIIENKLIPERASSTALLGINVLDISYGAVVGEELDQIREESDIAYIGLQIPGMMQIVQWNPVPLVGGDPRDPENPLRFEFEIHNNLSAPAGKYHGLVKIADTCSTGLNVSTNGRDGVGRVKPGQNPLEGAFSMTEFYTLQHFEINIYPNEIPIAVLESSAMEIESGDTVDLFPGAGTYDPDGSIILYEYDFDYDLVTFNANASNATGDPVTTPVFTNYTRDPITKSFAMRVTDDGDPAQSAIDDLSITVNPYDASGWAQTWGGSWADLAYDVAVADDHSIYVVGSFRDTVNFDIGGNQGLKTATGEADCFLLKLSESGEYQWVGTWGGDSDSPDGDAAYAVTVKDDFIYVTGHFYGTCDFDPGDLISEKTADAYGDVFLSKFFNDGTFLWVQTWGNDGMAVGDDVEVDNFGNVIVSGLFSGDVDLNPGVGTDWHYSSGIYDAFVLKLSSTGTFFWAASWGTLLDRAYDIAIDNNGDVYATGFFFDTVDFDPSSVGIDEHTSNGEGDVFLMKLDTDGIYQWTRTWGGAGVEYWQRDIGYGVDVDDSGEVYVVGCFNDVVDFDPGVEIYELTALGSSDAFLNVLTSDGDFVRAYSWGSEFDQSYLGDCANAVVVDQFGNVIVAGGFYDVVDFDPGAGTYDGNSNGALDSFILKLDSAGEFDWVATWGGSGLDDSLGLTVDLYGTSYVVGHFNGTVDFDPSGETDEHISNGSLDGFINKLPSDGEW